MYKIFCRLISVQIFEHTLLYIDRPGIHSNDIVRFPKLTIAMKSDLLACTALHQRSNRLPLDAGTQS